MSSSKRPIRVAGASGGYTDRQRAIRDLAKECDVDVITGGEHLLQSRKLRVSMKKKMQPRKKVINSLFN
jgi:4-hydroxy-3-methylbut-2-enyl diphosphate reductase IspH